MNSPNRRSDYSGQAGLSLIELLIALAISSFLILGITQIYIDNKRSYNFQQSQAGNQENHRFLVMMLDYYLNRAGYRRDPRTFPELDFKAVDANSDCEAFKEEAALTPARGGTGLCIRYFPLTSGELDCVGNATPAFNDSQAYNPGSPVTMVLRYVPSADLNGSLQCKVNGQTAELLTGIADFRMTLGMASAGGENIRERLEISDWAADKGQVIQVAYSALLASERALRSSDSLALSDWKAAADTAQTSRIEAGDKGQLFQVASSTVSLRNLMP